MAVIINPGSRLGPETQGSGWTNTYDGAVSEARRWLQAMRDEGFGADIELILPGVSDGEGRWRFEFRHLVTEVTASLVTHGIDDTDAYQNEHLFFPRSYWNDSSCSEPELSNWAAPGYVQSFRKT